MASLHVVAQLLLEHEAGHLHTLWAVERCVGLLIIFFALLGRLPRLAQTLVCLATRRLKKELGVHLFFCELEAVLEGLGAWRAIRWLISSFALVLLELVLVLGLLQDAKELELLPDLFL